MEHTIHLAQMHISFLCFHVFSTFHQLLTFFFQLELNDLSSRQSSTAGTSKSNEENLRAAQAHIEEQRKQLQMQQKKFEESRKSIEAKAKQIEEKEKALSDNEKLLKKKKESLDHMEAELKKVRK